MSSYYRRTKHPETGKFENAFWIDDYFGRHRYGVRFPSGRIFRASDHKWEFLLEGGDTLDISYESSYGIGSGNSGTSAGGGGAEGYVMAQPTDDDARLAEIRLLVTERPSKKLPPDTNKMRFLLRMLDEVRADERKKLVAMLRGAKLSHVGSDTLIDELADLLERAP